MQYIYTNLPIFVKITPRSATSNAVIPEGGLLLFSEDGATVTTKDHTGSYTVIGSGGVDPSSTTATPDKVLDGYRFVNSAGAYVSGTIPTVAPVSSGSTVNISSGYLASPVSIFVSGGVDVSDTTATPADVLSGALFHDSTGALVSGGILTYPASTYTPTTSAQYIPAGVYLGGSQTIAWDANLVAGNIVSGVTIFGVTGTAASGGGATDYYQCASVTSGGSAWSGYKAVLSGGSYSLESTVTSGLTYGSGFIPQVGQIYADGALVRVASLYGLIPTTGLVFYASLATSAGTAETGQTLTIPAGATFGTVAGIPCVTLSEEQITAPDTGMPEGNHAVSLSLWIRYTDLPYDWAGMIDYGAGGDYGNSFSLFTDPDNELSAGGYGITVGSYTIITDTWYHAVAVYDGLDVKLYINGTQEGSSPETLGIVLAGTIKIGNTTGSVLSIAGARIYNRALTESEIAQLAAEFSPA